MVTPASAVESISTGETTLSSDTKNNTKVAPSAATPSAATPAAPAKKAAPAHHAAPKHTDSATAATVASTSATVETTADAATASSTTAKADTGDSAAKADTGNTTAKADTGKAVDHLLVSPQEYEGWKMFSVYCYRCHGVDAMGGGIAPNLRHSVGPEGSVTHDVFITTVTDGRIEKGMPSWKALLSTEQMEDLWQYVTARSSGRLAPGRPHMSGGKNP